MNCACGDKKCTTKIGFDSASGIMIVERANEAIGVYVNVETTVILLRQLRAFILAQMDESVPSINDFTNKKGAHV
jgi:hypothetical protein